VRSKALHDEATRLADARAETVLQLARRLKADGMEPLRIARLTDLSIVEIEKL